MRVCRECGNPAHFMVHPVYAAVDGVAARIYDKVARTDTCLPCVARMDYRQATPVIVVDSQPSHPGTFLLHNITALQAFETSDALLVEFVGFAPPDDIADLAKEA